MMCVSMMFLQYLLRNRIISYAQLELLEEIKNQFGADERRANKSKESEQSKHNEKARNMSQIFGTNTFLM